MKKCLAVLLFCIIMLIGSGCSKEGAASSSQASENSASANHEVSNAQTSESSSSEAFETSAAENVPVTASSSVDEAAEIVLTETQYQLAEMEELDGLRVNYSEPHGEIGAELCAIIGPFMTTNAYYNLEYPSSEPKAQQSWLEFIVFGLDSGALSAPFDIEDYRYQQTGLFTIPRELFDSVLNTYLDNPKLDDDFLVLQRYLLPDKSAYTILIEGYGDSGLGLRFQSVRPLDSDKMEVTLASYFSTLESPDVLITFVFQNQKEHLKIMEVHMKDLTVPN